MDNEKNNSEWVVSYKQIGLLILVFTLGIISALLLANAQTGTSTTFTTTELIGFVLSVILSGASIVLAVSAIALGKTSEQAVIRRSDESIRLQTEVFVKTNEALLRIEASTGVTEKRIEDIISGRAGDLSRQIAEIATDEGKIGYFDIDKLEERIRTSIAKTISREETVEDRERHQKYREQLMKERETYNRHHNELMYAFANLPETTVEKLGHGTPSECLEGGIEGYDGVFVKNGKRIAISTFRSMKDRQYRDIGDTINQLASPLEKQKIDKLFLVLFDKSAEDEPVNRANHALSMLKEEFSKKITIATVPYSEAKEWPQTLEL